MKKKDPFKMSYQSKPSFSGNSPSPFEYSGRSYVMSGSSNMNKGNFNSPSVHSKYQIDEQTANFANIGVTDNDNDFDYANSLQRNNKNGIEINNTPSYSNRIHDMEEDPTIINDSFDDYINSAMDIRNNETSNFGNYNFDPVGESDPLIGYDNESTKNDSFSAYGSSGNHDYEIGTSVDVSDHERNIHRKSLRWALKPIRYIPAVFLGTLLNILDGLSYGMIMFPVSEVIFSTLAPAGLSMFYLSCVVSQLVYSLGGSAFKSGIGSEMIEVTPFFHTMALAIKNELGNENQEGVIATTIVTYAILSIVTGIIFFILGKLKLGSLVGFFPRHILVGCIGGVGYFLIVTGIEVASRLDGGIKYDLDTFKYLFGDYLMFLRWFIPLLLTLLLIGIQHKYHNSLVVPSFFIAVFVLFHLILVIVPGWNLDIALKYGWVFPAVEENEPWYGFYSLYKFKAVNWLCIARQFPTMIALTFFGILHVPINVPALAVTVGMDQFDVDRELVAHGYSNALSGLFGSIQNYLVYTNSVLFIRAGADDRLAGVMLAIATFAVMMAGPIVIGYIPICVVGSLIYLLGYELLKEALYDTYRRLRKIEYSTIVIIVVVMGAWDFVYGVLVGVLLACLSFVVEAATTPVVQGIYTGVVARSNVLRHPKQQEFLKDVGNQICVVKLQGTLFFGSIGGVEKSIRSRFDVENFRRDPVKFLILDMKFIESIDFSAAEGFRRILNLCNEFQTQLIISSVEENDEIVIALRDAGLWDANTELPIQLFNTLNYALEWCESSFLATYKNIAKQKGVSNLENLDSFGMTRHKSIVQSSTRDTMAQLDALGTTPRTNQVFQAANKTVIDQQGTHSKFFKDNHLKKQPLPLIMVTFQGLSNKDDRFWASLSKLLVREQIPENYTFYDTSKSQPAFFIVETGLVKSIIKLESDDREIASSILPMTAFGDLFKNDKSHRHIIYTTVSNTVTWKLPQSNLEHLLATPEGLSVYNELLMIQAKLLKERFDTVTANLVLS